MTADTPIEIRRAAREAAVASITSQLVSGETNTLSTRGEAAYQAWKDADDLLGTARDLDRAMKSAERDFANTRRYIHGEAGTISRLGILQANGPRIDVLVATFCLQLDQAVRSATELELDGGEEES